MLIAAQAVSVTYFMVTVLLIPSNLLMKRFSGKFYFPVIMILWGIIVMCIGAVKNKAGLFAARFFLGVPESGVVPACIMYFSFWYKPHERAWRIGIFHAANALASGVGGFLAVGIDNVSIQNVFLPKIYLTDQKSSMGKADSKAGAGYLSLREPCRKLYLPILI